MSAVKTGNPSPKRQIQQGVVVMGKNGLPVDSILSLDVVNKLLDAVSTGVTYSAPTVTVNAAVDLTKLIGYTIKGSNVLIFTDSEGIHYFIKPNTINNSAHTFQIYTDPLFTAPPTTVSLSSNWGAGEAQLFNRMATTSSTSVEDVHFNGVDIDFQLSGKGTSGDSVRIVDAQGDELNITPTGEAEVRDSGLDKLSAGMITTAYDYISFTKVPSGNGAGQIQTVTAKTGGSGGSTVATLTFAYDSDDFLTSITKS